MRKLLNLWWREVFDFKALQDERIEVIRNALASGRAVSGLDLKAERAKRDIGLSSVSFYAFMADVCSVWAIDMEYRNEWIDGYRLRIPVFNKKRGV